MYYLIFYNPYIDVDISNNFAHMRTRECVVLWKFLKFMFRMQSKSLFPTILFLQVCFQPSLPAGGIVKSPALVASNRKALEQIHLSKQNLLFDAENDNLEASLINQHHAGE